MIHLNEIVLAKTAPDEKELREFLGKKTYKKFEKILQSHESHSAGAYLELANQIGAENASKFALTTKDIYKQVLPLLLAAPLSGVEGIKIYKDALRILEEHVAYSASHSELIETVVKVKNDLLTQPIIISGISDPALTELISNAYSLRETTLAERLDLQYRIAQVAESVLASHPTIDISERNEVISYRTKANQFLQMVLGTDNPQRIDQLMTFRASRKATNSEYIPGMEPVRALPTKYSPKNKTQVLLHRAFQNESLQQSKSLLAVTQHGKEIDHDEETRMLSRQERDDYRVILHAGKVYQREMDNTFSLVDTASNFSKIGTGYAAFVLNNNGELSLFNHTCGDAAFYHSSLNSQAYVFGAGEIKIKNGVITEVTNTSGHYKPSVESTVLMLKYLQDHGVDLAGVIVTINSQDKNTNETLLKKYLAIDFIQDPALAMELDGALDYDSVNSNHDDSFENDNFANFETAQQSDWGNEKSEFDAFGKDSFDAFDNSFDGWNANFDNRVASETDSDNDSVKSFESDDFLFGNNESDDDWDATFETPDPMIKSASDNYSSNRRSTLFGQPKVSGDKAVDKNIESVEQPRVKKP